MLPLRRKEWFLDRIGFVVYRKPLEKPCPCGHCKQIETVGVPIEGTQAAYALFEIEQQEGKVIYFDNLNEMQNAND